MKQGRSIAFYCSSLTKGGAERVFVNLAEYFNQKGYKVSLVTQYKREHEYEVSDGIRRIISDITPEEEKKSRLGNFFARYRKLRNIFRQLDPDIVFSCNGKNNFMAQTANWGLHHKVVVSVVANPAQEYPTRIMRFLARLLFAHADGIVFQTAQARDFFPRAVRKKGVILPNSLNPLFARPRYEGERLKEIVAVGRLDDNKNHAMLIRAFAKICGTFPEYSVSIYGEGEDRDKLETLVTELKQEQRIFLKGRADHIQDLIYKSTLFVMTSDSEGMPNALLEAMSLGLCVISTDCPCGGPAELIENGKNGYLIPVRDEEALQRQLAYCLSHPEECEKVGRCAALLQEHISPERVNKQWEAYFLRVMGVAQEGKTVVF